MKICPKCHKERSNRVFFKKNLGKEGLFRFCRLCREPAKNHARYVARKIASRKPRDINAYMRNRKRKDPEFKLLCNLRNRLYFAFKKYQKSARTANLLGCSIEEARKHLESLFQPGMTWENYGQWHVDHIIPLKSAQNGPDMEKLCNHLNLQPLWKKDHHIKTQLDILMIKNIKANNINELAG